MTTTMTATFTAVAAAERRDRPVGTPRLWLATAFAGAAAVFGVVGSPASVGFALLLSGMLAGSALAGGVVRGTGSRRVLSVAGWTPVGVLVVTAITVAVTVAASFVGLTPLAGRGWATVTWVALLVGLWSVAARRGGRVSAIGVDVGAVAASSAVFVGGVGWAVVSPVSKWTTLTAQGTDFGRHLTLLAQLRAEGNLSYATEVYPRGWHSLVSMLWQTTGGDRYLDAWGAMTSAAWALFAVFLLAGGVITARASRAARAPGWFVSWGGPVSAVVVLLLGPWFSALLSGGFVTSVVAFAGVLAVTASVWDRGWLGSSTSLVAVSSTVVVFAHAWIILLPVIAAPLLVVVTVAALRRRAAWWAWVWTAVAAAVSAPAAWGTLTLVRSKDGAGDALNEYGQVALGLPEWYWWTAVIVAVAFSVLLGRRHRYRGVSLTLVATWIGVFVTVGMVAFLVSRTTPLIFDSLPYYLLKTMWTPLPLALPLAVATCGWAVGSAKRSRTSTSTFIRMRGLAVGAAVSALAVVGMAAAGGQISHQGTAVSKGAVSGFQPAPTQIALITAMEDANATPPADQPYLVWGVVPYARLDIAGLKAVGFADLFSQEAVGWFGHLSRPERMSSIFLTRSTNDACDFLKQNPSATRITGPNPDGAVQWLLDSDCPANVVKKNSWQSFPIAEEWYLPSDGTYPTYRQYVEAVSDPTWWMNSSREGSAAAW